MALKCKVNLYSLPFLSLKEIHYIDQEESRSLEKFQNLPQILVNICTCASKAGLFCPFVWNLESGLFSRICSSMLLLLLLRSHSSSN